MSNGKTLLQSFKKITVHKMVKKLQMACAEIEDNFWEFLKCSR